VTKEHQFPQALTGSGVGYKNGEFASQNVPADRPVDRQKQGWRTRNLRKLGLI